MNERAEAALVVRSSVAALVLFLLAACGPASATPTTTPFTPVTPTPTLAPNVTPAATPTRLPVGRGRIEKSTFHSNALNRTMQYWIYLPGGYDAETAARFPVTYLLHGSGGDIGEWASYGAIDAADKLMGGGIIPRFIIVMPEGDQEY